MKSIRRIFVLVTALFVMMSLMFSVSYFGIAEVNADTNRQPVSFTYEPSERNLYYYNNEFHIPDNTTLLDTLEKSLTVPGDMIVVTYSDGTSDTYHYEWIRQAHGAVFVKNGTEDDDPVYIPADKAVIEWDDPSAARTSGNWYGFSFKLEVDGVSMTNNYEACIDKSVYGAKVNGMYFDVEKNYADLYRTDSLNGCVVIPETVTFDYMDGSGKGEYPVESISHERIGVFAYQRDMISVTLPNTLVKIEEACFHDTGLKFIGIPASVKEIGDYAFGFNYNDNSTSDDDEYLPVEGFVVYGTPGTEAEAYALRSGLKFDDIKNKPEEPTPQDISSAKVSGITARTYDGEMKTQSPVVELDGKTLVEGKDYKVSYKNNMNAGTATVIITGKAYFKGTIAKTFAIEKAANTIKIKGKTAKVKVKAVKKKAQKLAVTNVLEFSNKGQGSYSYARLSGNKKITINKKNGKVTVGKGLKKGTYKVKVKVTAKGNNNYSKASRTAVFKVVVK